MTDDKGMETLQISRSGRVLKKSAKVKEMEDFDINELDVQGKSRKKIKAIDDFDDFDDKRVAPIKIPKISFNMQATKKKMVELPSSSTGKQVFKSSFQSPMKGKTDIRRQIYHDSSDASKESDSSSVSSESSSSSSPTSSDASDDDDLYNTEFRNERKLPLASGLQSLPVHQEKVIVEHNQQRYETPVYIQPASDMSSDDSEDGASDTALVIAEDSDDSPFSSKAQRGNARKRPVTKKDSPYAARQAGGKKKTPVKNTDTAAAKKKKAATGKSKPLSGYMLWYSENRKKVAAASGNIGFSSIGKKMGEVWQALPEKEKMAWRRKAKRLALKSTGNIIKTGTNTSAQNKTSVKAATNITDELIKGLTENAVLGTAPIDSAAHLKLLGDSLTVIGQRLIEHEGQLAVSGIYSVLLDTLLCAIGPLLCLTTEITGLDHLDTSVFKRTLDHIAYFMPGL